MRIKEQWQNLAGELGLEFKPGIEAFLELPEAATRIILDEFGTDKPVPAAEILHNPLVKAFLAKVFMGVVTGEYRGYTVHLFRGSRGSSRTGQVHAVNISMLFNQPKKNGLNIYGEGFFSRLGKKLFGVQDLESCNPELDKLVMIKAENVPQVQMTMTDPRVQQALVELYSYSTEFQITDPGIRYRISGEEIIDRATAMEVLDLMVAAASALRY